MPSKKANFTSLLISFFILFFVMNAGHSYCLENMLKGGRVPHNETDEFGKKQGLWRYKSGGYLLAEINYLNGKRHGLTTKYFAETGAIMEMTNYEDGVRDGEYKRNYYNGTINVEGEFKLGKKDGKWTRYNLSNGEVKSEGSYEMNKKVGDWKFYNSKGVLTKTLTYSKDGALIAENGKPIQVIVPVPPKTDTKKKGPVKPKPESTATAIPTPPPNPTDSISK